MTHFRIQNHKPITKILFRTQKHFEKHFRGKKVEYQTLTLKSFFGTGNGNVDIGSYSVPRNSNSEKFDYLKSSDTNGLALLRIGYVLGLLRSSL